MNTSPRASTTFAIAAAVVTSMLTSGTALAWGPDGHHTVAAIALKLIDGTNAAQQVKAILGTTTLEEAAVWADCAKGVDPQKNFTYQDAGKYPECAPFENADGEAAMIDFVKRNNTNCNPKPGEEICHKQYHYSDIAIQHDHYDSNVVGARIDDITRSINAAVAVLQSQTVPSPYSIKDKREALLLLAHYVGDIHQPLHVGAIYLDATGTPLDPNNGPFDSTTDTKGGNFITVGTTNLHSTWDEIPPTLKDSKVNATWLKAAKGVTPTTGALTSWSTTWASDTQKEAQKAFVNLKFGPRSGAGKWTTTLSSSYTKAMTPIKKTQLTKGGARLAQLLIAIFPEPPAPAASKGKANHP